jgi:epoxyqueuosine reductase QueG
VCPWNISFAAVTRDPEFAPRGHVAAPDSEALANLTDDEFARSFQDTPFARPGLRGIQRNARAVLTRAK